MKKHLLTVATLALLLLSACGPVYVVHQDPPPQPAPAPEPEASYQAFYDQLSPYGQWIQDPNYGYVWMPEAGPDFKPYATNGHWVYTEEGWAWDSDYPWGWATFHYGRWNYQDGYGWLWIPGNEWAPAWVSWRNSPDYYGWAPLGPNVTIGASFGGGYNPPPHYWCFVPHEYIASPVVRNYYVNENRNVTIIHNTTIINNTTIIHNNNTVINNRNRAYAGGPDIREAGRYSGHELRAVSIRDSHAPGERNNNDGLSVYRPRINPNAAPAGNNGGNGVGNGRSTVAPSRFQTWNNARPVNSTRYTEEDRNGNRNNEPGNTGFRNNDAERNGGVRNNNEQGQVNQGQVNQGQQHADQEHQGQGGQGQGQQPANQGQPNNRFGQPQGQPHQLPFGMNQQHESNQGQGNQGQQGQGQPGQGNPGQANGRFGQQGQGNQGNQGQANGRVGQQEQGNSGQANGRFGQQGQGNQGQQGQGNQGNPGQANGRVGQQGQGNQGQQGQGNQGQQGQRNQGQPGQGNQGHANAGGNVTPPAQNMSPGRRVGRQNGNPPQMNTIHPIVKPAPQVHPTDNKPKDDDKKRDKKDN